MKTTDAEIIERIQQLAPRNAGVPNYYGVTVALIRRSLRVQQNRVQDILRDLRNGKIVAPCVSGDQPRSADAAPATSTVSGSSTHFAPALQSWYGQGVNIVINYDFKAVKIAPSALAAQDTVAPLLRPDTQLESDYADEGRIEHTSRRIALQQDRSDRGSDPREPSPPTSISPACCDPSREECAKSAVSAQVPEADGMVIAHQGSQTTVPDNNKSDQFNVDHIAIWEALQQTRRDRFIRAGKEVGDILGKGPLTAIPIYKALSKDVRDLFAPRRIQEVLRWSRANLNNIEQMPDRSWYLRGEAVPAKRRSLRKKAVHTWQTFSSFAIEAIEDTNRPCGAVELYDKALAERAIVTDGISRACVSFVLASANNPELVKLTDGSWWLAGRDVPPVVEGRGGYHSRVRADFYVDLAHEVVRTISENGGSVTTHQIREALSSELANPDLDIEI